MIAAENVGLAQVALAWPSISHVGAGVEGVMNQRDEIDPLRRIEVELPRARRRVDLRDLRGVVIDERRGAVVRRRPDRCPSRS